MANLQTAKYICPGTKEVIGLASDSPLAWSSDGLWLAFSAGDHSIVAMSREGAAQTFSVSGLLVGHEQDIKALAFHPMEANLLLSSGPDGIYMWDVSHCRQLRKISLQEDKDFHESYATCMAFALGGQVLFTGGKEASVKVWDVTGNYRCMDTLYSHKAPILCVAFCRGNKMLATAGKDSSIKLWDASGLDKTPGAKGQGQRGREEGSGRVVLQGSLEGHRGDVTCLSWASSGLVLFSGGRDSNIIIWDTTAHAQLRVVGGHKGDVRRIVLLNREKLMLSASQDSTVKLWELGPLSGQHEASGGQVSLADILDAKDDENNGPPPELGKSMGLLDVVGPEDKLVSSLTAHDHDLRRFEVNPRFPLMATITSQSCLRLWRIEDVSRPQLLQEMAGHVDAISSLKLFHSGKHLLAGSLDGTAGVYDVASMRRLAELECDSAINSVAILPSESLAFLAGSGHVIKGFCLDKDSSRCFECTSHLLGHCGQVISMDVSPDGNCLASSSMDFSLMLWNVSASQVRPPAEGFKELSPATRLEPHDGVISSLAFARRPDRCLLATGGADHRINVYSVNTKNTSASRIWKTSLDICHRGVVSSLIWGRGSSANFLFSGSWDQDIRVWELDGKKFKDAPVHVLQGHTNKVNALTVTPAGGILVSSSADMTSIAWGIDDMKTIKCLCEYRSDQQGAIGTCIDCTDEFWIGGEENNMLRSWSLREGDWVISDPDRPVTAESKSDVILEEGEGDGTLSDGQIARPDSEIGAAADGTKPVEGDQAEEPRRVFEFDGGEGDQQ